MWKGCLSGWLGVLLLSAVWAAARPEEAVVRLTLEDAIEQALQQNRDLVKGALELQNHRLACEEARESARGIQIVPDGTVGSGSSYDETRLGLQAEKTGSYGTRISAGASIRQIQVEGASTQRRSEVEVEISQPLFRQFGPLMQNEPIVSAQESLTAARRVWERDRSSLVVEVVELYEALILLRHQIESDESFSVRMEKMWMLADAREHLGRATRTEVMRMDLQRGRAAARLEAERAQLDIRYQEFANLLGLPLDTAFTLVPPDLLHLDVMDPVKALAVAMEERTDYAQALDDIDSSGRHLKIARRSLLPDVRIYGRGSRYGEGSKWGDAGQFDEEDWFAGLTADMNLNLRGARLEAAQAGLNLEGARQTAEIVRHRLAVEVNSGCAEYRRSQTELELAVRNREVAEGRAELSRALFKAGRTDANSVSDAEDDLVQSQLQEFEARQSASVAAYRLMHILGTLMPVSPDLLRKEGT